MLILAFFNFQKVIPRLNHDFLNNNDDNEANLEDTGIKDVTLCHLKPFH